MNDQIIDVLPPGINCETSAIEPIEPAAWYNQILESASGQKLGMFSRRCQLLLAAEKQY